MHFHLRCVVLALAVSSSAAVPESCTIPAVNHGEVGNYLTKRLANTRSRECFYQLQPGESVDNEDPVILRCQEGYLPAGSPETSKIRRLKEDVVTCEDGTWSKPLLCEAEITCGEPHPIEFATVTSLFTENYALGAIVACECQPGHVIKGRSATSKCVMSDDGSRAVWTKASMSCTVEDPSSFPATTFSSLFVSTAMTPGTISPPKSSPEKPSQTAAPEPSIAGSLDSQNRDACCSTSDFLNTNVMFSDKGVKLLLGVKVKRGDRVQISCPDQTQILFWQNGLHASGPVSLTCDTCRTWDEEDIPLCVPLYEGDTWIVFNREMKLLPGGIVEVRQHEHVYIQCSTLRIERRVNYPEWRTSPPKLVRVLYNIVEFERGFQQTTFLDIDDFKADLTGRYECYAEDRSGHRYRSTILNLTIATPEVRCPILDEKDIFIINYNDSRKVNSIAIYFCRKQTQGPEGINIRTCLESGEWTLEEDPSCVDITCREFVVSDSLAVSYTKENKTGSKAEFRCTPPALLVGSPTARCLANGTWSSPQPSCVAPEIRCRAVDSKGTFRVAYSSDRKINTTVSYTCRRRGYTLHGQAVRTCQQNGEWSGDEPQCLPEDFDGCPLDTGNLSPDLEIDPIKEHYRLGDIVEFSCRYGFELTPRLERIMCLGTEWSDEVPDCKKDERA